MPKKELPLCACGCGQRVTKQRNRFFSHECSQKASRVEAPEAPKKSLEVEGDKAVLTEVVDEEIKSLPQLIAVCGIDEDEWLITKHICNTWGGRWQVKAFMSRKVNVSDAKNEIKDLLEKAKREIPKPPSLIGRTPRKLAESNLLELGIYDVHVGKLAWGKETGHGNYDVKIAEARFREALHTILDRVRGFDINRILLTLGNDLLNSDNDANTTYGGTPQSTDGRFHKTFSVVRNLSIEAVDTLRQIAPVDVAMVPGNHDKLTVWHLGDSLECYFHKHSDVTVLNSPATRKYYEFGANMLMLTHGDKGKVPDYPALMAAEQPQMWGRTKYREAHIGHKHTKETFEQFGCRVRTLSALCSADAWHAENAYVGNLQSAEAFIWNATEGLVGTAVYNVPER